MSCLTTSLWILFKVNLIYSKPSKTCRTNEHYESQGLKLTNSINFYHSTLFFRYLSPLVSKLMCVIYVACSFVCETQLHGFFLHQMENYLYVGVCACVFSHMHRTIVTFTLARFKHNDRNYQNRQVCFTIYRVFHMSRSNWVLHLHSKYQQIVKIYHAMQMIYLQYMDRDIICIRCI